MTDKDHRLACQNVEAAEPSTIAPSCRDLSYEKFARNSGKRVGPHRYPASIVMSADGLTEGPISRRGTSKRPTFVSPMAFHSVTAISMPGHACDRGHQGGVDAALIIGAVQGASLFLGSNASLAMAVEPGGAPSQDRASPEAALLGHLHLPLAVRRSIAYGVLPGARIVGRTLGPAVSGCLSHAALPVASVGTKGYSHVRMLAVQLPARRALVPLAAKSRRTERQGSPW